MLVLTIRTDKPESEIGLYNDESQIAYHTWQAHRQLAKTIHTKIEELLKQQNMELKNIQGIVAYKGPGSFTGLRIGASVGDALAYGLGVPIVGASGDKWQSQGIAQLETGNNDKVINIKYGSPAIATQPRK